MIYAVCNAVYSIQYGIHVLQINRHKQHHVLNYCVFFCEFGGGSSSGGVGDETFIYFHQLLKYHWLILYGNMTAKGYFIRFTSLPFMRIFCLYGS